jgi:hypothetical protein
MNPLRIRACSKKFVPGDFRLGMRLLVAALLLAAAPLVVSVGEVDDIDWGRQPAPVPVSPPLGGWG